MSVACKTHNRYSDPFFSQQDPFQCDPNSLALFLDECLSHLNNNSVIFFRQNLLRKIISGIEIYQTTSFPGNPVQTGFLSSESVRQILDVAISLDLGLDSLVGTSSDSEKILEMTAPCKYVKYVRYNDAANFWREKWVCNFLGLVFSPAKNCGDDETISPQLAAVILGVSIEMLMAHKPGIKHHPTVRYF